MATGNVIISVRGAATDRQEVELVAGTTVDAFSVGAEGGWRITAPGIASVHAYLYFDGTTLFVCSAAGERVEFRGTEVGTDWRAVKAPSEISLGSGVVLDVRSEPQPAAATAPVGTPKQAVAEPGPTVQPGRSRDRAAQARQTSKPVRPPAEMMANAPAPAAQPGDSAYDDSEAPTHYQPMPEGFMDRVSPPSIASPDSATQVRDMELIGDDPTMSDEKTQVMPPPSEIEEQGTPIIQMPQGTHPLQPIPGGVPGQQASFVRTQAFGPGPQPVQRSQPRLERPEPPSNRAQTDAATVVKPLEQFLADARAAQAPPEAPDTTKRPLGAPTPAAGQPPDPRPGAQGVIIAPGTATEPPYGGFAQQGYPGAPYGQPQMQMQPGQISYPAQPQAPGVMPGGMGYPPQQQYPGAPPGQYPQGMAGYPGQPWPGQATALPAKNDPLAMWKAMPFPRKLMIIMLPFGLIAFIIVFLPDRQPAAPRRTKGAASASASVATTSSTPPTPSTPVTNVQPPPSTTPPTSVAPPPTTAPPPDTAPPPSASAEPKLARGEVTDERKAVDAVAAGDVNKAIEIYDQLAKQHPDNPAFAQAAEILRRRAKK